eukprot:14588932-Alexandrium_andersonii.AAC.1
MPAPWLLGCPFCHRPPGVLAAHCTEARVGLAAAVWFCGEQTPVRRMGTRARCHYGLGAGGGILCVSGARSPQ